MIKKVVKKKSTNDLEVRIEIVLLPMKIGSRKNHFRDYFEFIL